MNLPVRQIEHSYTLSPTRQHRTPMPPAPARLPVPELTATTQVMPDAAIRPAHRSLPMPLPPRRPATTRVPVWALAALLISASGIGGLIVLIAAYLSTR